MNEQRTISESWPDLPLDAWRDTSTTLQLWTQVVGKIRLVQTPWLNHSWHVTLYVTARGLTTSPIPYGERVFQLELDFIDHVLRIDTSDGAQRQMPLQPQSVAQFYAAVMAMLADVGLPVTIDEMPNEVPEPIRFSAHCQRDEMRRRSFLASVCIVVFAVAAAAGRGATTEGASAPQPVTTVFEASRLIVGDGTTIADAALVVSDGKIVQVGPRATVKAPAAAARMSLPDRTVMPMLVDLHGHTGFMKDGVFAAEHYSAENIADHLRQLEYFGVGAFLSLGTDMGPDAWAVRERQRATGAPGGARLLVAGRGFVAPGGGPTVSPLEHVPFEVDRPEMARLLVRELAAQKADMVKVWVDDRNGTRPKLPPDIYRVIIDEAHRHKLRVMAHVYYLADAKELVRSGIDGFAHMVRDLPVDDEFVALARERNVFFATSMAVQAKPISEWIDDPAFTRTMTAAALARLKAGDTGLPSAGGNDRTQQFRALMKLSIPKLKAAGLRLALGGDTGIPTRFVGYNEHLELQAMVAAGLTPLEAITAGTSVPASILGLDDIGALAAGKSADFVVLDGNPLERIEDTLRIADVYRRGRAIDRSALATVSNR
ncbi:MAG: DUF5996 family protein [Vicinamibacterales bacterium]